MKKGEREREKDRKLLLRVHIRVKEMIDDDLSRPSFVQYPRLE